MRGRWSGVVPLVLGLGLVWALSERWGNIPPIGEVLNPFNGLWHRPSQTRLQDREIKIQGLTAPVMVLWDEARVPHIQAQSERDLAWAQGYVHASQRLFQMELQARLGGGRLSELIGELTLSMDRFYVKSGLRESVHRSYEIMKNDAETKELIDAYAEGVNAWINEQTWSTLPTEFRLLKVWPQTWSGEQVAEFFMVMSFRLSGRTHDLPLTALAAKYGKERIKDLFPELMPSSLEVPIYEGFTLSNPPLLGSDSNDFIPDIQWTPDLLQLFSGNGSNNWAISGTSTRSKTTILANDPHLGLALPGVWFEQELIGPQTHVYGGGFAGAPGVLVGFSPTSGWAVTNGTTDVLDWYQFDFKDGTSLEYQSTTGWKVASVQREEIKIRGRSSEFIDLVWTDVGPLYHREGDKGLAMRWTVHDGSDVLAVFRGLNRAKSFKECDASLKNYHFPIQNFICADAKNIGIRHAGLIPLRKKGQGRFVMDGQDPKARWSGYLKFDQQPHLKNPPRGFVASANQRPTGHEFPLWMGWETENTYRGFRLVEELKKDRNWSADEAIQMQSDNLNPLARRTLPKLLSRLSGLSEEESAIAEALANWDFYDTIESVESSIFYFWWQSLKRQIWADQFGEGEKSLWPKDMRLDLLIERTLKGESTDQVWIDDIATPEVESLDIIIHSSFRAAVADLKAQFGPVAANWSWGKVRPIHLQHVARLPGFDIKLEAPGSRYAINAMRSTHGPAWRMVVVFNSKVEAWTSVQGSSSGDPLSQDYTLGLNEWAQSQYKKVLFSDKRPVESLQAPGRFLWSLHAEGRK